MIRAVFFDVANTLLHKGDLLMRMQEALQKNGIQVSLEHLAERHKWVSESMVFPDKTSRAFYEHFNAEMLLALGAKPSASIISEMFEACTYLPWSAFDDCAALEKLTLPKGVLSNWDSTLREKLKEHITVEFDWVLGSADTGVQKPNPVFFQTMIQQSGFDPGDILFIGDSMRLDISPALDCGIKAVLIDRNHHYPQASVKRITSLHQIFEIL
ncbi:MAG: HAD family hydrolase [Flavobacteriales bacterium]